MLGVNRTDVRVGWRRFYRNSLLGNGLLPSTLRVRGLRRAGMRLGAVSLADHCYFGGTDVAIGDGSFVNAEVFFDSAGGITIGEGCAVGMRTLLLTSGHAVGPPDRRAGPVEARPISIGRGCWIGAGVTILPGVTVGEGCVVAAGAVLTRDCVPDSLYAGVPARLVRALGPTGSGPDT